MTASPFLYRPPATDSLPIIHADEAVLVVDKPSGLLSVPGRLPEHKDSLFLRLQALWPDVLTVHRLDMSTSGLMVFALSPEAHRFLSVGFERRKVKKAYLAKVWGHPVNDRGEIDLPLIRDWPNRPRQKVCFETGKPSKTVWACLRRDPDGALLRLTPETGRTHQLRVHLSETGHPILGDDMYGTRASYQAADRLLLHASELAFTHPVSREDMHFHSEADFAKQSQVNTE